MLMNIRRILILTTATVVIGHEFAWAQSAPSEMPASTKTQSEGEATPPSVSDLQKRAAAADAEAIRALEMRAEAGNGAAMMALGNLYAGTVPAVTPDGAKAMRYFEQAAGAGNNYAFVRMGELYRDGTVVPADPAQARAMFEKAQAAGVEAGTQRLAEGLVQGKLGEIDAAKGLAMLETLAAKGNAGAAMSLGNFYAGTAPAVTPDGAKAIQYFEQAAGAGNNYAFVRMGELYRDGTVVPADPAQARAMFEKAQAAGVEAGTQRLAEGLVQGKLGEIDAAKGLAMLETLAAKGNAGAAMSLGNFYAGTAPAVTPDGAKAIQYFEQAAGAGNTNALVRLAQLLREGKIVEADPSKSLALYRQAADLGSAAARTQMGLGHLYGWFGAKSQKSTGLAMIRQLAEEGDATAATTLANMYFWGGNGLAKDPALALRLLRQEAQDGNPAAVRSLVAAYRDGRGKDVPRSRTRAEQVLQDYGAALKPEDMEQERFMLDVAYEGRTRGFAKIVQTIAQLPKEQRLRVSMNLRNANPNAYTYLLQDRLAALGRYGGAKNGLMTAATIRAVSGFCADQGQANACIKGPLSADAANAIMPNLWP